MTTQKLDYKIFDADYHYYEVEDTFVRFGDAKCPTPHPGGFKEGKRRHVLVRQQDVYRRSQSDVQPDRQARRLPR